MALVATIAGTLNGVPVAIEVSGRIHQRFEDFRSQHRLGTEAAIAMATRGGAVAFTPLAVEDFLNEQAPVPEGEELGDMGVAPTA